MISFNVGGKLYHVARSTIMDKQCDTLLEMLVRNRERDSPENTSPIDIDRDPKAFRWILQWYRTGELVNHKYVGMPATMWEAETDFYLIGEVEEIEEHKSIKPKRDAAFAAKVEAAKKRVDDGMTHERTRREEVYQHCLEYMMSNVNAKLGHSQFTFVCKQNEYLFTAINFPEFINGWWEEFYNFCIDCGWRVVKMDYNHSSTIQLYNHPPASDQRRSGCNMNITIHIENLK